MDKVTLSPRARKALVKIPDYIQIKLYGWAEEVERFGLEHVRTAKGYHDEPLKGVRRGQPPFDFQGHIELSMSLRREK